MHGDALVQLELEMVGDIDLKKRESCQKAVPSSSETIGYDNWKRNGENEKDLIPEYG